MGKKDVQEILDNAEETRGEFSLRDRLAGVNRRTKTVTIYTDAVTGDELGYAKDEVLEGGFRTGQRIRKGIIGEMDALEAEGKAILTRIEEEEKAGLEPTEGLAEQAVAVGEKAKSFGPKIAALRKKLDESALVFTLHAVPDFVIRDARRQARLALGIKGKGIPDAQAEDYGLEYLAQILSASTGSWEDHLSGEKHSRLTVQQAKELRDFLPYGQFDRLDAAMTELSFQAAIDNSVTDNPDF